VARDPKAVAEEEMILERLLAIRDLRSEIQRLESDGVEALKSDIAIPAGLSYLLVRGLEAEIEAEESDDTQDWISEGEHGAHPERMRSLLQAIRDRASTGAYAVSPEYHGELRAGLRGALRIQKFEAAKVSDHRDPPGLRFIAKALLVTLYQSFRAIDDLMDAGP
jgi:hypothetical protein